MYRKSVDYGNIVQTTKTVDFTSFKRKNQPSLQMQQSFTQQHHYTINDSHNIIALILTISGILLKTLSHKKKGTNCTLTNVNLKNVPKQYHNYQHPQTIEEIYQVISVVASNSNQLIEVINNYPICQFVFNYICRSVILSFRQNNHNLDAMGNEEEVIEDYALELRGNLIDTYSKALNLEVKLNICKSQGKEEKVTQQFGLKSSSNKIQINYTDNIWTWQISSEQSIEKLSSTHSYQNIVHPTKRKQNQAQTADDGINTQRIYESRSVNKDLVSRCLVCGKGKVCNCNKRSKGVTPRQINNNPNRSFFDGIFGHFDRSRNRMQKVQQTKEGSLQCKKCKKQQCLCSQ